MYVWCIVLFCLGILAFLDTIFNMGEIFRTVNSILFMLISMGLLVRVPGGYSADPQRILAFLLPMADPSE